MVKLPDAQGLLGRETPQWRAFSPGYRLPNMDPGTGDALRQIGSELSAWGREVKSKQDQLQAAQAETDFSINNDNLYFERSQDQDYQNAPGRFWQESQQNIQGAAEKITDPQRRALFIEQATRAAHTKSMQLQRFGLGRFQQETTAANDERLDDLAKQALINPDADYRGQKLQEARKIIDSEYWLSPKQRESRWKSYRQKYSGAYVLEEIRRDPDAAIQQLDKIAPQQPSKVGPQSSIDVPTSPVLAERRSGFKAELESNPDLKKQVAAMAVLEGAKDPVPVIESLANRYDYVNSERKKQGLPPVSISQMLHNGFYGPINRGQLPSAVARLEGDQNLSAKMGSAIDAVLAGSNTINGATDQGLPTDPNGRWQGGRVVRGGNVFNDWGGGPGGHEGARAYRESLQQALAGGNTIANQQQYAQADTGIQTDAGPGTHDFNHESPDGIAVPKERRTGTPYDFLTADQVVQLRQRAVQEQRARLLDAERMQRIQEHQIKLQSDQRETEILQDAVSDDPKVSVRDIVNDPKLSREAKERLPGVIQKLSDREDRLSPNVSHRNASNLISDMRRDEGDPQKITSLAPVYDALTNNEINRADFNFVRGEFEKLTKDGGERFDKVKGEFFKRIQPQIDKSNPLMGQMDPSGSEAFYRYQFDMSKRMDDYRKAGKNPWDLLDPNKPDYIGSPQILRQYQKTLQQSLGTIQERLSPKPGAGSALQAPTIEQRKSGESIQDYLKRTGQQ